MQLLGQLYTEFKDERTRHLCDLLLTVLHAMNMSAKQKQEFCDWVKKNPSFLAKFGRVAAKHPDSGEKFNALMQLVSTHCAANESPR